MSVPEFVDRGGTSVRSEGTSARRPPFPSLLRSPSPIGSLRARDSLSFPMANTTDVAAETASELSEADLDRVREFSREPILLEGETIADLEPGTARRRAVETALAELAEGREAPSFEWRRDYSLLLGLERLLWEPKPSLRDGAELNDHQVDALSGTLAAITAEVEGPEGEARRNGRGNGARGEANGEAANGEGEGGLDGESDLLAPDEEPQDWDEAETAEVVEEAPEDPGASRRFWFEHATGAGKTVAAVGFVEASRTGGVLILTHRRNLVDQFIGEISDRGYKERLSPALLDGADHPYGPVTVETYQWFVRNAGRVSDAYSIVDLRRGTHRARREDQRLHPQLDRPGVHRHDRDRRPDRPPRRRPLPHPDLTLRPRAGRSPRRDRAPALHPHPPGPRGEDDRQRAAAPRRGRSGLRPGGAGGTARPGAVQRRRGRPLPVALPARARRRLHRRRPACEQRRQGVPESGHQRAGGLRRDAEARADRDPGRLRARRGRRALQRDAARRGLELAAGDDLHAPRADRLAARLPAARRARHPPQPGQGSGAGDRLRPPGDHPRRDGDLPAQPARPRRLPRRRDRRRPGAPRARAPGPGRAPRGARLGGPGAAARGARARAMADRRREPELLRAARLGGPRRRPRDGRQLAPGEGDDPARPGQGAAPPIPAHLPAAQPQPPAAPEGALRGRRAARGRGLRRRGRGGRDLAARRAPSRGEGPADGARGAPHRPARPGAGMGLAPRGDQPRAARGVRRAALARDQAPARPLRQLLRARARPQCAPHRPRRPPAGPPAGRRVARRRGRAHAGGRGGPPRGADADGEKALGRGPGAAAQLPAEQQAPAAALLEPVERRRWQRRGARAREARGGGGRGRGRRQERGR